MLSATPAIKFGTKINVASFISFRPLSPGKANGTISAERSSPVVSLARVDGVVVKLCVLYVSSPSLINLECSLYRD